MRRDGEKRNHHTRGSLNMYCQKETITPEKAVEMLTRGHNVREMTTAWVKYFCQLILRGEFVATPDGVCFDLSGRLVNGQHRLSAIVMSGVAVEMWVWHNVPAAVIDAIDQGRKRRVADVLGLDNRVIDVLSFSIRVAYGPGHVPVGAVRELTGTPYGEAAAQLIGHCGGTTKYFASAPVKTAAVVQIQGGHADYVLATYSDLVHHHVANLPPVAASFVNQLARGTAAGVATNKYDALARALVVFDPSKRNLTKIQLNNGARDAATEAVRVLVRKHLSTGPSAFTSED